LVDYTQCLRKSRPASFAGRAFVAILLIAGWIGCVTAQTADELLQRADHLKTANNSEFQTIVKQLDAEASALSPAQRDFVDYLHAWQLGYLGQYAEGVSAFQALLARTTDAAVRARALISLINNQVNASHYEEAYSNLSLLLDSLPEIQDHTAHFLSLIVATVLYNEAGQHDLALHSIDQALAYDRGDRSSCIALSQRAATLVKDGKLGADDADTQAGLDACLRIGDVLYAGVIRTYQAQALIDAGRNNDALQLLQTHDAEMLGTHSAAATSIYRALLARCHLLAGDLDKAREYALSAIDYGIKQSYSKSVADAYETLYEAAKQQGHYQNALDYHEKYATADKAYLNDTKARALAYQMVHQEVLDKKREVDALSAKNKVLELQGEVDAKASEARLLYIALLLSCLVIVGLWAYRTKRSQIKFQKLARRDGLTGIFNRQHFFETAQDALRYCAKSSREASLLVLDLDHFKSVNDTHGHAAGDAVLKRAVAACQARLRSIDLFGRLGGEEFAVLLPDCTQVTAAQRAEEMREAIAASRRTGDAAADVQITASFGVAATKVCGYNLPTLLANADNALYVAKNSGRNRVATFQPPASSNAVPA